MAIWTKICTKHNRFKVVYDLPILRFFAEQDPPCPVCELEAENKKLREMARQSRTGLERRYMNDL